MLVLIGLGLWDEKDITLRGIEEARKCDLLYLENYTSKMSDSLMGSLEHIFGRKIQLADRNFVEGGDVLNYAVSNSVALLVPGDPMIATTHSDLLLRAKEKNVQTKIIHNASIYTAIAETGLQIYKFGRSAAIPFWIENYKPTSFYDVLSENKRRGLHTMLFLDLDVANKKFMTPNEAFNIMIDSIILDKKKRKQLSDNTYVVVCSRLGSDNKKMVYGRIKDLIKFDFGLPPHIIIVPGKLHEIEEKCLEMFR